MSQENEDKHELHALLGALCNGTLDESAHARLQAMLMADRTALAEYLAYIDLHLDLKRITAQAGDLPLNSDSIVRAILETPPSWHTNPTGKQQSSGLARKARNSSIKLRWAVSMAVAATLMLLAVVSWLNRSNTATDGSAGIGSASTTSRVRLTQVASARFFGEANPQLQSIVPFGHEYVLSEGMVELQFPAGAVTIIESPAIFEVFDDARLLMKTGICSVHAPEGAQGFRVDTPMANVVDLGTRFVLSVSQSGETKVQVVEGEADVFTKPMTTGVKTIATKPITLREHEARFIESEDRAAAKEIPFEAGDYKATLPDRITGFEAVEDDQGAIDELLTISVQRNAVETKYTVDQLIGFDVIHFRGTSNAFMVTPGRTRDPAQPELDGPSRARFLDRDHSLCSGLINPGGQAVPLDHDPVLSDSASPDGSSDAGATPGIGIRFHKPVVNNVGPDVVVFELQTVVNSEKGDAFHVSPLHFKAGLHAFTVRQYDIDLTSPQSRYLSPFNLYRSVDIADSLSDVLTLVHRGAVLHNIRAKIIAVGIDLTDLGYPQRAECEALFLQDAADDSDFFDPVFIAGLPTTEQ